MASVETNQAAGRRPRGFAGKKSALSLRIDMTPMVDLGFLLITFFIFTSTLSTPSTMNLFMPDTDGPPSPTAASGSLSIIIDGNGRLFYYEGQPAANGANFKTSSLRDIRKEIIRKKQQVISAYQPDAACEAKALQNKTSIDDCKQKNLVILIKPTPKADYGTVIAVLDEMSINKIARYVLTDADEADLYALSNLQ